jgi:hypothetical protein
MRLVREGDSVMRDRPAGKPASSMRRRWQLALLLLAACACATPAAAIDFELGDTGLSGSLRAQVAVGAAMRMEDRRDELVGKLNLPGQQQFCEDKAPAGSPPGTAAPGMNCQTVAGNAAFMALPGAPSVNNDNGDLDYDQGDLISAAVKFAPRLQLTWGDFGLDLSGLYFYDGVNSNFTEYHPNNFEDNNGFQPRNTPRPDSAEDEIGSGFRLMNAYVSGALPLFGDRQLAFKIGDQVLSLGTSTLLVFNSLNTVNPPDANLRYLPGSDTRDVFRRVPLASLSTNLTENIAVQGFYQYGWKPIALPPIGSYFSANDIVGAGNPYVVALFGKYREDPTNQVGVQERTQGNANLLSDAGRTLFAAPEKRPRDGGQYGVNLSYFAEALNNTSFGLTYLQLHSRFPIISFIAAQQGCTHDATNQVEAIAACNGFRAPPLHAGKELIPIDTMKFFIEYPEDIHSFGASFSTNLGQVAWTGEAVYRPDQPLQIDPIDLGFAALQPIFPADNQNFLVVVLPSRRTAAPDYVETIYRHNPNVRPGQVIQGYERLHTMAYDTSFLLLRGASENPFRAEQMTVLLEVGAFHVLDLPSLDQLQIAAPGPLLHHSAGVDGTGTPTAEQNATGPENRLNPTYKGDGFATSFSWGYRVLSQLTYEDVLPGVRVLPQVAFFHDVGGRSPLPTGEFVAGRKQVTAGVAVIYHDAWSGSLRYNMYFGAGDANGLLDRDNLQLTLSYDF